MVFPDPASAPPVTAPADPASASPVPAEPEPAEPARRIILVTGLSGAGLSTALKALEDLGYEALDNLPLFLLPHLLDSDRIAGRPLAVGIDSRTREFSAAGVLAERERLADLPGTRASLLFVDCADEVLLRRFTETRRRHPLAADRPVADGIALERAMLQPLRAEADLALDTSDLSIHDLRRLVGQAFSLTARGRLAIFVTSFSYRHGLPREADLVFDVRFLDNPHWVMALRPLTGLDAPVAAHVAADPGWPGFESALVALLRTLLPRYQQEGKSYLTLAFGCTGGRHRSVFVAERLTERLRQEGWDVQVGHRELERARRGT